MRDALGEKLLDLLSFLATMAVSVGITWLITRFYRSEKLKVGLAAPRKDAMIAIGYTIAAFLALTVVFFLWSQNIGSPIGTSEEYDLFRVLYEWAIYAIISFAPVLIILKIRHQNFESVGFTKKNWLLSVSVGLILSALWLGVSTTPERFLSRGFTSNAFYGLLYFLAVGLGEELLFRGYLQLRCVAWLGQTKGLIVASVIMAYIHLPQRLFVIGMNPGEAVVSATFLIPVALMLGFLMLRTQNLLGSTILHIILNWTNLL